MFLNSLVNKKRCKYHLWGLLWMLLSFCSCQKKDSVRIQTAKVDGIEDFSISNYVVISPDDSTLLLQSYPLSMAFTKGQESRIMVYDEMQHSLDVFRDSSFMYRIRLPQHGNNAIKGKVLSFLPISEDSVWIYDQVAFYLINRSGKILCEHKEEDYVLSGSNYAMHTAHMGCQDDGILLYPTTDGRSVKVKSYDSRKNKIVGEIPLAYPDSNPKGDKKYPYMEFPNVTFAPDRIIYNFPYEDNIHVINLPTAKEYEYLIQSEYSDGPLKPYGNEKNFSDYMQYNWGNNHYYEVSYLPGLDMYVRPMLGASDLKRYGKTEYVVDARRLYLTFMDNRFNTIGEIELVADRYSNFHGWCAVHDGVAVYADNLLGEKHEELVYDVIRPVMTSSSITDSH